MRELVDAIALYLELSTEEAPLNYKIVWKASYEPTQKEKAELGLLKRANCRERTPQVKTVDEVRKDRFKLKPLPNGAGAVVIGLAKPAQPKVNPFNPDGTPKDPQQIADETAAQEAFQQSTKAPAKPAVAQGKQESPAAPGADAAEINATVDKTVSRTLPILLKELGQGIEEGKINKDEGLRRGKNMITEYSRLELEHALLWIKHRTNFPG